MFQVLGQVPGLLIVSTVSGLATMMFGGILMSTHGRNEKRNTRVGTRLFLVGLAISLIAVGIVATT